MKKLTVKDIVEECHITRQSFYYHFEDIPGLLQWILEQGTEKMLQEARMKKGIEEALQYFFLVAINAKPYVQKTMQTNYGDEIERLLKQQLYKMFERLAEEQNLYPNLSRAELKWVLPQMQTAAAAGDRVFDFLQEEELPEESYKTKRLTEVKGEVEFDHVRFSYPDNPGKIIIKDFSAHVEPGQKVAIVGPTGAGKTTMVNLLMRFFDINSGDIRIDGISTSELTRENVHSLFSMVLQDTWLFEGTVRENLVYNKTGVTDETLENACRACGIYHFIETLPHGLDTVLGDNITISAGQKQLFTIARAMVQNSPMLILDEATSSVDTRTELIAQKTMDTLMEHRTSFVIAHRLSTIKNADLILVMKDGDILEQGNHETLLAQNGFYAELYNSQFEKVG